MVTEVLKNKEVSGNLAIWSITPNGKALGQIIQKKIPDAIHFISSKIANDGENKKNIIIFKNLSSKINDSFYRFSGHIFIFSTGIAVRMIAPLLNSKMTDPAVVVSDDCGKHAISLVSGHIGGANQLAEQIAAIIGAKPVITTATDTNKLPSIDLIAKDNGLYIETPRNIKHVNMAFLKDEKIVLDDPLDLIKNDLPKSVWVDIIHEDKFLSSNKYPASILCSYETKNVSHETLILRPPILTIGIGCNRGTTYETIKQFLYYLLEKEQMSVNSIYRFATVDIKKDEAGLLTLSEEMEIPIDFFEKNKLNSVQTIENPSKMVEKHLGVKSVCEAAAILSAQNGKLIVPKMKNKDVTMAVAIKI